MGHRRRDVNGDHAGNPLIDKRINPHSGINKGGSRFVMIDCTRYFSTGPVAVREKGGLIGLRYTKPGRAESPAIGRGVQCYDSPEAMSFCQNCPLEECAPSLCGNPYLPGTIGFGERRGRPGRLDPDEIRRLIATGCSANETARILGAHRSTISYWIKKLGIQAPKDGWSTLRKARVYGT
jgi:hypothetical protein